MCIRTRYFGCINCPCHAYRCELMSCHSFLHSVSVNENYKHSAWPGWLIATMIIFNVFTVYKQT